MKLNWGHGITIFYICFASILVFVVVQSRKVKHNLVVDNYYNEDLAYQDHMKKRNNYMMSNNIIIKTSKANKEIEFRFLKSESVSGQIHFYRPDNKEDDFFVPVTSELITYDTKSLREGKWKIKVDWQDNEKKYYHEKDITL